MGEGRGKEVVGLFRLVMHIYASFDFLSGRIVFVISKIFRGVCGTLNFYKLLSVTCLPPEISKLIMQDLLGGETEMRGGMG